MRQGLCTLGLIALLGTGPRAQALPTAAVIASMTPQGEGAQDAPKAERAVLYEYDGNRSRALFAACDDDGDDRLDLFETRAAMADIGDPSTTDWFRRLDQSRDGYLEWPEFDRFFRDLVRNGGTLRLWHRRPLAVIEDPVATGTVAAPAADGSMLSVFDQDHDGALDGREAAAMLRELNLPSSLLGMMQALDTNRDGKYSASELRPALERLNISLLAPKAATTAPQTPLPALWAAIDRDGDQNIDVQELGRALRRIDPQLQRWAPRILAARDRNGDGRISVPELPVAAEAEGARGRNGERRPQAMVEPAGRR
ncbi:MAG: hypothetical protein AB7O97_00645 [Planctomycetota bacterium]